MSQYLPYEQRLIRSITIQARSGRSVMAEVALATGFGEALGSVIVGQTPTQATIRPYRPMKAQGLHLQSLSQVLIDSIEIEFDQNFRY